jgi:uncharacterized protein with GYD domain
MPKYLVQTTLTADALKLLQRDKASGRRAAVAKAVESLGGKLEGFFYSLGDYDVVGIVEMPDLASVSAVAMALSSSGLVRTKTTALLSVEETDRALEKIGKVAVPGR